VSILLFLSVEWNYCRSSEDFRVFFAVVISFFDCKYNSIKQVNSKFPIRYICFEKTFSLTLAVKLQNILRVGYSNPNDALILLISVLACLCTMCCIFSATVLHLTLKRTDSSCWQSVGLFAWSDGRVSIRL
jgi:hypothetical protein